MPSAAPLAVLGLASAAAAAAVVGIDAHGGVSADRKEAARKEIEVTAVGGEEGSSESESSSEPSPFDKLNSFLDTPILDANNRQDQGFVAETLKEFVRNEPEVAQVSFSIVVVCILVLLLKLFQSIF